ncbi:long-chain-fatty-acid--CoA ligase [Sulfolobus acidocaldarius]|uniref:Medium-chain-fatty-acid-CoA ligase n=3 Tax=Sulfolobus acidocaldarius TaxID=2285 RepID=Q4J9R7_SULAC|nr:long-chain-fatty-acid--CoA ligase [Sulfolobus acidocaldarius]AAY80463.1 medium-chain-fatty-acid-CoA ligase [Sulfolobus acidocaldarius DSM 639]AGE71048.1 medium-chain-fatty-acid-CoA ligase [Sulfolobus acidocaldarius N8]AGE73319.1 medium-chain-fatty-acid-CoA ligase [Sulfolobus acidocaldarius Ron12/I]WCM34996.1 long-chain-fatty-acid--CoA ligase [Sulfolobus acidocaldarius DSM 639]
MIKGIPSTVNDEWQLNLHKVIEYASKVHGEREIISDRRFQGGVLHNLNYRKIFHRISSFTNSLEKELNTKAGDIIGILGWNDHRYFESFFTVPSLGAVLLELNIRLHPADLLYILKHTRAKGLLVDDSLLPLAEALSKEYNFDYTIIMSDKPFEEIKTNIRNAFGYEELVKSGSPNRKFEEVDEKSTAFAAFTTGTTGLPKGVFYSHRSVVLHALNISRDLKPSDVILQAVPFFHVHGWGTQFAGAITGCKQIFPGRPTVDSMVEHILNHKVTRTAAVPTVVLELLRRIETMDPKPNLAGLRLGIGGAEPPSALVSALAKHGIETGQGYGATETGPVVVAAVAKPEFEQLPVEEKFKRLKQGLILFGVEVKVVDPVSGEELPWDGKSVGEIWFRGPWIARSYYNDPRSAESFTSDGWWKSKDLGVIDELGYVKLVDRLKDVVKSGGEWISSIDLENFLMAHPYVREASVVGVPHPKWGERPLAVVSLKPEYQSKDKEEVKKSLLDHLSKRFAKWQLPDDIVFVDEIPKTSVGKFRKEELRNKYKDYYMKQ